MGIQEALRLAHTVAILLLASGVHTSFQCLLGNANTETGHALVGASFKSFTAVNYSECLKECVQSAGCKSLNFVLRNGTCDLNSETKHSRPGLYVRRDNILYTTKTADHRELTTTTQTMTTQTPPPTTELSTTTQSLTTQAMTSTQSQTTQTTTAETSTSQALSTPQSGQVFLPKSCLVILRSGYSVGDGVYSIDPDRTGIPIQAYCDMTTDGGGWTIIKKTIFQTTTPPQNLRIQSYRVISEFNSNDRNIFPTSKAFLDILQKIGFHQIHYYCYKKSVGRVVSIRTRNDTVGHQVVRYFTDDSFAMTNFVAACGSFDRLPEDTSVLGQNCAKWNKDTGTWGKSIGSSRTLSQPFYIKESNTYGCNVNPPDVDFYACDDDSSAPLSYNAQDLWQISVR